jgi:hypothetical protein
MRTTKNNDDQRLLSIVWQEAAGLEPTGLAKCIAALERTDAVSWARTCACHDSIAQAELDFVLAARRLQLEVLQQPGAAERRLTAEPPRE